MSTTNRLEADGSALEDTREPIEINRGNTSEKWRFRCPNGHTDWYPTNSHVWCKGCRRQLENGDPRIDDAEHWELFDTLTDETIPFSSVALVDDEGRQYA